MGILCIPIACDDSPSVAPAPPTTNVVADDAAPRRGYEIAIPSVEYWEDSTTPKYSYEMRFDPPASPGAPPKLHRNGWARAYYRDGTLEREGAYRYNATSSQSERVGTWTYYTQSGDVLRVEERGGPVVWTTSDQIIAVPGTEDR